MNGFRDRRAKSISVWAGTALLMMIARSIGTGIVPAEYSGAAERFSVFAAAGFNAALRMHLFNGFKGV